MNTRAATRQEASVWAGRAALEVGELALVRDGRREYSAFAYSRSWLAHTERFEISPDLPLREGYFTRRAPSGENSPFPLALADTEPDTRGKRIIQRAHAKLRQRDPSLGALTRFDLLTAVVGSARGLPRMSANCGADSFSISSSTMSMIICGTSVFYTQTTVSGGSRPPSMSTRFRIG